MPDDMDDKADDLAEEIGEEVPDEPDLEELDDDVLLGDDLDGDDDVDGNEGGEEEVPDILAGPAKNGDGESSGATARKRRVASEEEEEEDEDEEELGDDDVEAGLDEILKERLVAEEDEDEEESTDTEDRADGTTRVLPKQPGEFVCRSCFLVKNCSQLSDARRSLCRDCV